MFDTIKRAKNFFEDSLEKFFNLQDMEYESYEDVMKEIEELEKYFED